jgi:hypothetical protein
MQRATPERKQPVHRLIALLGVVITIDHLIFDGEVLLKQLRRLSNS